MTHNLQLTTVNSLRRFEIFHLFEIIAIPKERIVRWFETPMSQFLYKITYISDFRHERSLWTYACSHIVTWNNYQNCNYYINSSKSRVAYGDNYGQKNIRSRSISDNKLANSFPYYVVIIPNVGFDHIDICLAPMWIQYTQA